MKLRKIDMFPPGTLLTNCEDLVGGAGRRIYLVISIDDTRPLRSVKIIHSIKDKWETKNIPFDTVKSLIGGDVWRVIA